MVVLQSLRRLAYVMPLLLAASAAAQTRAGDDPSPDGEFFSSIGVGVELQLPAGDARTRGGDNPPEDPKVVAVVTNARENWRFELRQVDVDAELPLRSVTGPEGTRRVGLLEGVAMELQEAVGGDLLRMDLAPLPDADAGVFAVRYTLGPQSLLHQEAIIRPESGSTFRMSLVSPAPAGDVADLGGDAAVRRAVAAFNASFNSFATIDQTELFLDQRDRLERTRAMFVNLKTRGRLAAACGGELWLLIRRNGQAVGFARVIEEPADELPSNAFAAFESQEARGPALDPLLAEGVRVGVRLRMVGDGEGAGVVDRASWSWADRELDAGDFRELSRLAPAAEAAEEAEPRVAMVIGQMRARRVPVRGEPVSRGPGLGKEPTFDIVDRRRLEVTFTLDGEIVGDTLERDLPAFYIPQAVDHLLPRLVATWKPGPAGYMVATYVPGRREVYSRYLDVAPAAEVTLPAGGRGRAIIVTSRLGHAGEPTRHYVDANDFTYLGSVTPGEGLQVIPTSRQGIEAALPDALASGR